MNEADLKRFIVAVQACRRKIAGLEEDDTWRAFLAQLTGKASLRAMNGRELGKVLDELHRKGAPKTAGKGAGRTRLADTPQAKMIRAIWLDLVAQGKVRDPSEKALGSYVFRMTGVSELHFLPSWQAGRLIESMKRWQARLPEAAAHVS